jgi:hypothetical protein
MTLVESLTLTRGFLLLFFFIKQLPWGPWYRVKPWLGIHWEILESLLAQRCQWPRCAYCSSVKNTAVHVTLVSIPLWMSLRCQWHRCAYQSIVNDTAGQTTLPNILANVHKHCFYEEIWLGCTQHSCVNDTAVTCTAVSLTPLWHALHSGVNNTHVTCTAVSMTPCDMHNIAHRKDTKCIIILKNHKFFEF